MADRGIYPLKQVSVRLKISEGPPLYGDKPMADPDSAVEAVAGMLSEMDREFLCVVNLDTHLVPLNFNIVSIGGINTCQVPVSNVFKAAILTNAARLICFHNHPSGMVNPSTEDIEITKRLAEVGRLMDIDLVDHIIIGGGTGKKYSLRENKPELFEEEGKASVLGELKVKREHLKAADTPATVHTPKRKYHSRSDPPDGKTMKEKLTELTEKLEQGVSEIFTSENYTNWLRTMSRFHHYSMGNTILIALQAPYASQVAGFNTWKKLHRYVRKGQKGIKILVPTPVKVKEERQKLDPVTAKPLVDMDGNPMTETEEHLIQHYKIGHVFAYEQTEGEPLPSLGPDELTGDAKNFEAMKQAVISIAPVPVRFDEIEGGAKGYYSSATKEIVVKKGMSEMQTLKTLFHELAHSICHDLDTMDELGIMKDRQTREVEAESCAWTCLNYFGLDTSDYSFPYITGWSSGRDMKELRSSMEFIRDTSCSIIDSVMEKMEELDLDVQPFSVLDALEKNRELAAASLFESSPERPSGADEMIISRKVGPDL